jgi:hypothetical protein
MPQEDGNMNKTEKGQGMVEFAIVFVPLIVILTGIIAFGTVFWDISQANNSGQAATHAAAIYIGDSSGATCRSRAMNALGSPHFIYADEAIFTIEPCSGTNPYWVGPINTQVVGTWTLTVNPRIPFLYDNGPFPVTLSIPFTDTFR